MLLLDLKLTKDINSVMHVYALINAQTWMKNNHITWQIPTLPIPKWANHHAATLTAIIKHNWSTNYIFSILFSSSTKQPDAPSFMAKHLIKRQPSVFAEQKCTVRIFGRTFAPTHWCLTMHGSSIQMFCKYHGKRSNTLWGFSWTEILLLCRQNSLFPAISCHAHSNTMGCLSYSSPNKHYLKVVIVSFPPSSPAKETWSCRFTVAIRV